MEVAMVEAVLVSRYGRIQQLLGIERGRDGKGKREGVERDGKGEGGLDFDICQGAAEFLVTPLAAAAAALPSIDQRIFRRLISRAGGPAAVTGLGPAVPEHRIKLGAIDAAALSQCKK